MYTSLQLAKKYIRYYITAHNGKGHGMHSPFVFDFILHVLNNRKAYSPPVNIESVRRALLHNNNTIEIKDLGAGSRISNVKQKKVRAIARTAVKPKKWSRFLFRLVKHYRPKNIIELGTSLGVSTAYMAAATAPGATVYTIEGSPAIQQLAQANFQQLGLQNIQSLQGAFDDELPKLLQTLPSVDLAYVDGNHRLQPTLHYFQLLLQKRTENSIFIFDDIHWSEEMESAWAQIKAHESVRLSIDLFFVGLVFFKKEFKIKQHFTIRF